MQNNEPRYPGLLLKGGTPCGAGPQRCHARIPCKASEALAIIEFLEETHDDGEYEHVRRRVESAAGSMRRLDLGNQASTQEAVFLAGGVECPFLLDGCCTVEAVQPETCRNGGPAAGPVGPLPSLPEAVSAALALLPDDDHVTHAFPAPVMRERRASAGTAFDENWQDDRHDFLALDAPLVLPEEGEYGDDLVVVHDICTEHSLYEEHYTTGEVDLCCLFKNSSASHFDWTERRFKAPEAGPFHTLWMSDTIQERMMMWEAAKRSRGRVLVGGLGLGVYPQYALGFPAVDSVEIVEMDAQVIAMIAETWGKQPFPGSGEIQIHHAPIETFLQESTERYDTVYIDTWDALTVDYLPHVNFIRTLCEPLLNPGGEIILWGYESMLAAFMEQARYAYENPEPYRQASAEDLAALAARSPLLHTIAVTLREHPDMARDAFLSLMHAAGREPKNNPPSKSILTAEDLL